MNTKHTPGPWTYDSTWSLINGPKKEEVAAIHSGTIGDRVHRQQRAIADANARLIAAAPEMLEALKLLTTYVEEYKRGKIWDINFVEVTNAINKARAAIARAEGK